MRKFTAKATILLLIVLLLTCLSQSVFASTYINYTPTKVHFTDDGNLMVNGYWSNSGSQKRHVKSAFVTVYLVKKDGTEDMLAKCNFPQIDVAIPAGNISKVSFTIKGVKRTPIERWHVIIHSHDTP